MRKQRASAMAGRGTALGSSAKYSTSTKVERNSFTLAWSEQGLKARAPIVVL